MKAGPQYSTSAPNTCSTGLEAAELSTAWAPEDSCHGGETPVTTRQDGEGGFADYSLQQGQGTLTRIRRGDGLPWVLADLVCKEGKDYLVQGGPWAWERVSLKQHKLVPLDSAESFIF